MSKHQVRTVIVVVGLALALVLPVPATSVLAGKPGGGTSCPIAQGTDIVVYGQMLKGGVGTSSRSWMTHFFAWWQAQDPDLHYQFLTAADAQACANLRTGYPNLKMWVQPGGDAYDQQSALGAAGKTNIAAFIAAGGAYFGVCAGAYYAAPNYWWEGKYYAHPYLLGAYPATLEGAISAIAPWPGHALTTLSNGRHAIYYGGPTIGLSHTSAGDLIGEKLATFADIGGALPAVIAWNRILLTSVHLEAFEGDGITELSTADREANYAYLAGLINRIAGTTFDIVPGADPTPSPTPGDPGGGNPPGLLIADGFESGLSGWVVSGPGSPWTVSTVDPNSGTRHALAKQPGVSSPTYLEISFDLSAYTGGTLSYYRKRIGLDGPDEFAVEYYDGAWHSLEATGASSANDAAYSRMSFALPRQATRIRFACMAGAVSEKCEVDDVALQVP